MFLKKVSYAYQGYIYLIKKTTTVKRKTVTFSVTRSFRNHSIQINGCKKTTLFILLISNKTRKKKSAQI